MILWRKSLGMVPHQGGTIPPSANLGYDAIANKPMTDVAKADQILTQAGYVKNANGMYAKMAKN